MRFYRIFQAFLGIVLILSAAAGCGPGPATTEPAPVRTNPPPTTQPTAATTPVSTPVPTITVTPKTQNPEHRIAVRAVDGRNEFFDRVTGEKFIPRGYNYIRVAPMSKTNPGLWHSTLNPGFYEPERAEAALQAMHAAGYNTVRIFVDCCREGNNAGDPQGGVSQLYLENVIDFMNKAKANEIYVLMVMDLTPAQGGYDEMWSSCCKTYDGENLRYLTEGGHTGERRFNQDFIRALIKNGAPMESIFAYDLTNEVHFSVDKPPFSLTTGKVLTANGVMYDMSSPEDKQRMMDENLVYWIDQQRASILKIDPTALVTVSFPGINAGPAIYQSTADFIDLHIYLGWGSGLEQYMQLFGLEPNPDKLVILGEFGAAKRAFPTAEMVAQELMKRQAASCEYGFDGWLLWTFDTHDQTDLWHGMSDLGQINQALAPANRPDPCQVP